MDNENSSINKDQVATATAEAAITAAAAAAASAACAATLAASELASIVADKAVSDVSSTINNMNYDKAVVIAAAAAGAYKAACKATYAAVSAACSQAAAYRVVSNAHTAVEKLESEDEALDNAMVTLKKSDRIVDEVAKKVSIHAAQSAAARAAGDRMGRAYLKDDYEG